MHTFVLTLHSELTWPHSATGSHQPRGHLIHADSYTETQPCPPRGCRSPTSAGPHNQLSRKPTLLSNGRTATTQRAASQPAWPGASLTDQHAHYSAPPSMSGVPLKNIVLVTKGVCCWASKTVSYVKLLLQVQETQLTYLTHRSKQ